MAEKHKFLRHSRKIVIFAAVFIVLLISGIYAAYYSSPRPQRGPRSATISSPLEFAIETDKTEYLQGENVSIQLTLTNIGDEIVSLGWPWQYMGVRKPSNITFAYYVVLSNGTLAYNWSENRIRLNSILYYTLRPGDNLVGVFIWDQPVRAQEGDFRLVPAERGVYSARGYTNEFTLTAGGKTIIMALETPTLSLAII